jgi:hypothetical protein
METLICPQCGAQLDESHVTGDMVRCQYCATEFRVPRTAPVFEEPQPVAVNLRAVKTGIGIIALMPIVIMLIVFAFVGGMIYFVFTSLNHTVSTTVNSVLQTANDAKTQANAMKAAANAAKAAANAATNGAGTKANSNVASPTPTRSKQ